MAYKHTKVTVALTINPNDEYPDLEYTSPTVK